VGLFGDYCGASDETLFLLALWPDYDDNVDGQLSIFLRGWDIDGRRYFSRASSSGERYGYI
jgi:hypothetical protein